MAQLSTSMWCSNSQEVCVMPRCWHDKPCVWVCISRIERTYTKVAGNHEEGKNHGSKPGTERELGRAAERAGYGLGPPAVGSPGGPQCFLRSRRARAAPFEQERPSGGLALF